MTKARAPEYGGSVSQLPLDLPTAPRFGREEFLPAASNRAALDMIERWPDWPDRVLMLIGPKGAGKSHLCAIWAARACARAISPDALPTLGELAVDAPRAIVIDDVDRASDETALFHLLNFVSETGAFLLMSAARAPRAEDVRLPDLLSRLRRAPAVEIGAPDEQLVRAVLVKLFADRQLIVEPPALAFAALRLERSLDAARAFVAALDREALAQGRPVTRALAAKVMDEFIRD
jgi:chromosomal replication initiation ATPase DnaA